MEFIKFEKIPRLSRDCIITEKIDGTNAQIFITAFISKESEDNGDISFLNDVVFYNSLINEFIEKYCVSTLIVDHTLFYMFAGSRKRWITPEKDNYGFAKWVKANSEELFKLGEGHHYGEWWGQGIQRKYDMKEKVFSLFNVGRWVEEGAVLLVTDKREFCPNCCKVVPVLYRGMFNTTDILNTLENLRCDGSCAAPGFMKPEGIVIYHTASRHMFKKTIENDESPKTMVK